MAVIIRIHSWFIRPVVFKVKILVCSEKYVCAFRGRRDAYQVPLALAESGRLERFITDAYSGSLVRTASAILSNKIRTKIQFRHADGIPDDRVSCLWGTTVVEHIRNRLGCAPSLTCAKLDRNFSHVAEACARRGRANLFLYSPYAWEAFTASYPHHPRKFLFQFHPHPDFERQILEKDFKQHPEIIASFHEAAGTKLNEEMRRRESDCWRHADAILCASSFTRESVLAMGADPALCHVIPYGINVEAALPICAPESFNVLFVGNGIQRKGLHHLLEAWKNAGYSEDSSLTLVCREMDPELEKQALATDKVKLIKGTSPEKLKRLLQKARCL